MARVFVKLEGTSVVAARTRNDADVVYATAAKVSICLLLLLAVPCLSLCACTQPEPAGLKNPSMAFLLEHAVGTKSAVVKC